MSGTMKFIKAATGVAAAVGILILGVLPGFPPESGCGQSPAPSRRLDAASIVVDVPSEFSPSDYALLRKVEVPSDALQAPAQGPRTEGPGTTADAAAHPEAGRPPEQHRTKLAMAAPATSPIESPTASSPASPLGSPNGSSAPAASSQAAPDAESVKTSRAPASAAKQPTTARNADDDISMQSMRRGGKPVLRILAGAMSNAGNGKKVLFTTFKLENPPRFVVDVQGVYTHRGAACIAPDSSAVRVVRAGRHPKSFRVVLDMASASAPLPEVVRTDSGLDIILAP